jgi:membrane-associated phospholipid phosphatase
MITEFLCSRTLIINKHLLIILLIISKITIAQNSQDTTNNYSPYNFSFKKELPFIAVSTAVFGTSFIVIKNNDTTPFTIVELDALNRKSINKLDRNATRNKSAYAEKISNYSTISSIALPILLLGTKNTRKDIFKLLVLGIEIGAITRGTTSITKNLTNRARPYTYNNQFSYEDRTDESSKLSFFSGHTSASAAYSFFFAKVITDYHPNMKTGYKIGVWSIAALLPASTAHHRVKAGNHYPTDVIAGYAVGALIGWLVPELHKRKEGSKPTFSLLPYNYNNYNGLSLTWKL